MLTEIAIKIDRSRLAADYRDAYQQYADFYNRSMERFERDSEFADTLIELRRLADNYYRKLNRLEKFGMSAGESLRKVV